MRKQKLNMRTVLLSVVLSFLAIAGKAQTYETKTVELDKTTSSFVYGEVQKYWVKFTDGTSGYIWYSPKYSVWYISDGGSEWEYKEKEKAIKALYVYKTERGKISDDGRKR